jgi:hypothetical protein
MKLVDLHIRRYPPIHKDVYRRAVGTTQEWSSIPLEWYGRDVMFTALFADLLIVFGDAGDIDAAMTLTEASTNVGNALAHTVGDTADVIPAWCSSIYYVPKLVYESGAHYHITRFATVMTAALGEYVAYPVSPLITRS